MPHYKTRELANLFPDAYAADDAGSLLFMLLDVFGAELMVADEKVKQLLKSHWVNYASGEALDGLGTIYGVERRRLRDGELEFDDNFRLRLKAVVPTFTGGGTKKAVLGAVRSALGLPFDLEQLKLPEEYAALRADLEALITLTEFSPKPELLVDNVVGEIDGASELTLVVEVPTVKQSPPRIRWTFSIEDDNKKYSGRQLSLERLDNEQGIKSKGALVVRPGETLVLSTNAGGNLSAVIGTRDVSDMFTNLDDSEPAVLPEVPLGRSEWRFRAQSALLDFSRFDEDETYDLPEFEVEMSWLRYEPLTFDVHVPYFLEESVNTLRELHKYSGSLFAFQGLPLERIQEVVDQTRAAGVRGHVHFTLNWVEDHDQYEMRTRISGLHHVSENAGATDSLSVGSFNRETEAHEVEDKNFVIGGVWDVSTFDGSYGFE